MIITNSCHRWLPVLARKVFQYWNEETVREIEAVTPADEDTPVEALIEFFDLERFVSKMGASLPQMN
ncbi:MAG: hypothetical protein KME26_08875 [Oscillatoria princeps RMCB-10]|jgi:hypothetical protein|nr:hypothetical protein [Oscillatoria princeps RMCB-10]